MYQQTIISGGQTRKVTIWAIAGGRVKRVPGSQTLPPIKTAFWYIYQSSVCTEGILENQKINIFDKFFLTKSLGDTREINQSSTISQIVTGKKPFWDIQKSFCTNTRLLYEELILRWGSRHPGTCFTLPPAITEFWNFHSKPKDFPLLPRH